MDKRDKEPQVLIKVEGQGCQNEYKCATTLAAISPGCVRGRDVGVEGKEASLLPSPLLN